MNMIVQQNKIIKSHALNMKRKHYKIESIHLFKYNIISQTI